ncbi:MAG: hypothetical protein JST00_00680 [Deltaproteobacteria bacterium]|nr:hypothetical protein [Deltaproteobacteria bacterium]
MKREASSNAPPFRRCTLGELTIDDEKSFRHVGLYADLKQKLLDARYELKVLAGGAEGRWDRALFLNLTYWANGEGDVLVDEHIPADVVTHVAWHHLAAIATSQGKAGEPPSADALFFGESIASAFDLYLVGRLLGHAPTSSFLETQVPAIADAASAAGMSDDDFDALLQSVAADPERAFEDHRQLLFDATCALVRAASIDDAARTLASFDGHRFAALLHHNELSNWVLYARAYASDRLAPDAHVRALDRTLRESESSLAWLEKEWLGPARG